MNIYIINFHCLTVSIMHKEMLITKLQVAITIYSMRKLNTNISNVAVNVVFYAGMNFAACRSGQNTFGCFWSVKVLCNFGKDFKQN